MPLDALTLRALTAELSPRIVGSKIDRVQQPARDVILLSLRGRGENLRLVLSAAVGSARLHITETRYENPQTPPMFCMLLRKHLQGGKITGLTQLPGERVVVLAMQCYDELGFSVEKRLVLEMIGRATNLILLQEDGLIVDCLRRVDAGMNPRRQVLPGLVYRTPPQQDKLDFFAVDDGERRARWASASEDAAADDWLLRTFSGLSPLLARELCYRTFGDTAPRVGALAPEQRDAFPAAMEALCDVARAGEFTPWMVTEAGRPRDFSCIPIHQYGPEAGEAMADFSTLLDAFYARREKQENMRRRAQSLTKTVRTARDRTARKLALQEAELKKTALRDEKRKFGDLITANLYRMERGASVLRTEDYYTEGCPEIEIPLDALKTPQQNAAAYYKEYTKAKTAEKYLSALIAAGRADLDYLNSVLDALSRAEGEADLSELRRELVETGYIKTQKGAKKEREKASKPLHFRSSAGLEIWVGCSNIQNDALTTRQARRTDLWLHAQKIHGSHVIVCAQGQEVDAATLEEAASLAALYSQAGDGAKIPVDYTQVRNVKKPAGARPGQVIYTDQRTILAAGDEELARKLRVD